ncbi:MAG TPA: radical SAM family heme chaperone HemW [bacterium]|nr:radical SAM family heme chaperone HemW [bacterium]
MNAYLHVPFCASICSYCDFTSFAGQDSKIGAYAKALGLEIAGSALGGPLQTVYFGGGTPSVLAPDQLSLILQSLREKAGFAAGAEISLEANPETADPGKFKAYRELGVNRLSFGAQAAQGKILRRLGRGHDWPQVEKAFTLAREAGFDNLNLDLMLGLPGQTPGDFKQSLEKTVSLQPDHLSVYALQVEEGTPLARQVAEGLALPSEDEAADEYALAQDFLAAQGFEQYEVSNFAKPGKACRHNLNIWRGEDYWGFGLSAVGTVGGVRHSHNEDLTGYLEAAQRGERPALSLEPLTPQVRQFEKLMLGLRTREGVSRRDWEDYEKSRGLALDARLRLWESRGLLTLGPDRYQVTPRGFFVLNGLLEALVA